MNTLDYRRAMEQLSPDPALEEKIRSRLAQPYRPKLRSRRTAGRVLIAAAAIVCTLAAALAVSPELRQMVISLFRIEEVERVPETSELPTVSDPVTEITLGEKVKVQYVHVSGGARAEGELLENWGREDVDGRFFYALGEDGTMTRVDQGAREVTIETQWDGLTAMARFRYFIYHNRLYLDDTANTGDPFPAGVTRLFPEALPGRTDQVLLYVNDPYDREYWTCDLETGELTQLLSGCGTEEYGGVWNAAFSPDLRYALAELGGLGGSAQLCLVDMEAQSCTPLSERMGMDVPLRADNPSMHHNEPTYEAAWMDEERVVLTVLEAPQGTRRGAVSCWVYNAATGQVFQTVDRTEFICGDGWLWVMEDEDGRPWIVDVRTGERTELEAFPFQSTDTELFMTGSEIISCAANETGTRLLCVGPDENGSQQMGVIDLETGTFRLLEREGGPGEYHNAPQWLGEDRAISGYLRTDEGNYLCVYQF